MLLNGSRVIKAVGESHYQNALSRICGGRSESGYQLDVVALLVPGPENRYDSNAVAVVVAGATVGYLCREDAERCHEALARRIAAEGRPVGCRAEIRGGWDRGGGDVGSFGIELFFSPSYIEHDPHDPIDPIVLGPAAEALLADARERVGRTTPPGTQRDGKVQRRHYSAYAETIKVLKREGPLEELIDLLHGLVDATEDESAEKGWGVAPAYYEELAVAYRKRKDYAAEVAVLERFAALPHAPGVAPGRLLGRLEKARALLSANAE